ncbi:Spc7-domain-containing protein [Auriscalpium vulgare]|uniref:Spc7-domain-containing protein n=1 Tax=Auriscalpium vulgare TaxID=40419 RepID=A0ACB8S8G1_9AGAM|nr:Spc7-domain-containing protein [Auriscalpium vulgare]
MTGIRFMDELAAPRRSTIHPSQLARRSSISADEVSLAEYFIACAVDVPQLELYGHVARDLTGWIEHAKEVYNQAEEEAAKCTPALFREYSAADEEVKEELLHQLKLIKVNNNGAARSQWYDWRLQWVEQLYATADQGFIELTEDAKALEGIIGETQGLMPSLREEHARVMEELAAEQAIAADIENSDQDYLSELKNTIAEQGVALDAFRTDVGETNAKLERLEEKLAEIEAQKAEAASAIADSRRLIHIQKNSTSAEVFRLKDELAALEALHLWHTAKIQPDLFEFVYASRFHVSVPCVKFRPIVSDIRIARTADMPLKFKDAFPRLTELTVRLAQQRVRAAPADTSVRRVVQALGGLWSGYHQLRTQFAFLAIRYPLTVDALPPAKDGTVTGAIASADVLLPSAKAKVVVSFILDADTMSRWPMSIGGVRCQVKKAYGRDKIRAAVQEFVAQTNPDDNHACFLDACVDATYEYQPQ